MRQRTGHANPCRISLLQREARNWHAACDTGTIPRRHDRRRNQPARSPAMSSKTELSHEVMNVPDGVPVKMWT
ncbi:MAG TPA: hypothetical protein PLP08_18735, partial [Plasticicumulans sp.]|uniref:hypothetical protein n=1 Tax=Plasticicumulans sp. TaxID=2307179 RepID=UPI002CADC53A